MVCQYGKPVHHAHDHEAGEDEDDSRQRARRRRNRLNDVVLLDRVVPPRNAALPLEMTAAGIEVAKVKPTFRPRYTFAAVNTSVIIPPMIMPRSVSSLSDVSLVACGADTNIPLAALNRYLPA